MASAAASSVRTSFTHSSTVGSANSSPAHMASTRQRGAHHNNGIAGRPKLPSESSKQHTLSAPRESDHPEKHANDRLLFLAANFVGCIATVIAKDNAQYTGVFSGASLDSADMQYVLKMTKRTFPPTVSSDDQQVNGNGNPCDEYAYVGYGDEHAMVFDIKDVVDLNVDGVSMDKPQLRITNGSSTGFRTDTDISGNVIRAERELKAWESGADASGSLDLSLNGSIASGWDQFEANERLYNVKTDYDENIYTTAIDRSHPTYKQRAAAAEKLAREIEGTASSNSHIAEERGQKLQGEGENEADDEDEEEKFSGVKRDFPPLNTPQGNKYTPPARRAPTAQSTVPGASVDPAIISSQLVKPDVSGNKVANNPVTPPPPPALPPSSSSSSSLMPAKKENAEPALDEVAQPTSTAALEKPKAAIPSGTAGPIAATADKPLPQSTASVNSQTKASAASKAPPDGTVDVEQEVLNSFKHFAAHEKLKMQERAKATQRKEKEVKLNDLKKFAANFKLKTAVPTDIIGILAKDKQRQVEIVEKSQRQLEESNAAASQVSSSSAATTEVTSSRPGTGLQASGSTETPSHAAAKAERHVNSKASRASQFNQSVSTSRLDRSVQQAPNMPVLSPRTGNLGQRLLMNTTYGQRGPMPNFAQHPGHDLRIPPMGPAALNTDSHATGPRGREVPTPAATPSSRFNAQASEFRPNPTANTFMPSVEQTNNNPPAGPRNRVPARPTNRVSLFGGRRPGPLSEKRSIKENFNPILRMKKETEGDKAKNYASNGGIPKAHQTSPAWPVPKENETKTIESVFQKSTHSSPNAHTPQQYQGQLLPHLSQGGPIPAQAQTPHQQQQMPNPGHYPQGQGREQHAYEEHSMRISASNSTAFPSPRYGPSVPHYVGAQQMPQMPGSFAGPFMVGLNGQPIPQTRQFSQGGHFVNTQAPPMMMNQSSGGSYMNLPTHNMPMYSPGPGHVVSAHMNSHHTSNGPNGFPSPRQVPPMMMHQGSQQGHAPYPYVNQLPPMYNQHSGQGHHGRGGGVPMQQQQSYGSSPHMGYHFPSQQQHHRGGPQLGNHFPQHQQMHPNQIQHQSRPSSGPVIEDSK